MNKFTCPVCKAEMKTVDGGVLTKEGNTVYCANPDCSAQEVAAHGRNEKAAYETVLEKFKFI